MIQTTSRVYCHARYICSTPGIVSSWFGAKSNVEMAFFLIFCTNSWGDDDAHSSWCPHANHAHQLRCSWAHLCLSQPDETGYPRLPIWTAPATCVHFHWTSCMHAAQPAGRFLLSTAPAGERSLPMVWGSSLPGSSAASLRAHHFFIWGAPQRGQRERGSTLVVFREPILFSYSSKASCRRQCYNTIKYDLDAQCCGLEADALLDILSFHLTCMQSCDR